MAEHTGEANQNQNQNRYDDVIEMAEDGEVMAARMQFVKSRIQPVLEGVEKEIKQLQLLLDIMTTKMKLLTGHRKVFQDLEQVVMKRGDFRAQDSGMLIEQIKMQKIDDDKKSSSDDRMFSVLNKVCKLLGINTAQELKVEDADADADLKGGNET